MGNGSNDAFGDFCMVSFADDTYGTVKMICKTEKNGGSL